MSSVDDDGMQARSFLLSAAALSSMAAVWSACTCSSGSSSSSSASSPCAVSPPPGPADQKDFFDSLPKTDAGLPIVALSNAGLPPGVALVLAYDSTIDDAVSRWADCISLVDACYSTTCGSIVDCIDAIPACPDPGGGAGCCPAACNSAFHTALSAGEPESQAAQDSFVRGDCVAGFTALTSGKK